jgi:hypothetical protein
VVQIHSLLPANSLNTPLNTLHNDHTSQSAQNPIQHTIPSHTYLHLFILDDFGLQRLGAQQSTDLCEIIIARHRRSSFVKQKQYNPVTRVGQRMWLRLGQRWWLSALAIASRHHPLSEIARAPSGRIEVDEPAIPKNRPLPSCGASGAVTAGAERE